MYVKPSDVLSPRGQVKVLDVLYDGGEWDVSVARLLYRDDLNAPYEECTGIRWNGNLDEGNKGMPLSRGYPVWFIIPQEFSECLQARALDLNTDDVPAVITEIKMQVEQERKAHPHAYMLEYKTERNLSASDIDTIMEELRKYGIFAAFTEGAHTTDINGVHTLNLMFPSRNKRKSGSMVWRDFEYDGQNVTIEFQGDRIVVMMNGEYWQTFSSETKAEEAIKAELGLPAAQEIAWK